VPRRLRKVFPLGPRDFALQLSVWLGFVLLYQVARGLADRDAWEAFRNGQLVIDAEARLHGLVELDLQRLVSGSATMLELVNWTYWLSQFAVVGLALLWIYFFRTDSFLRVRNLLITANLLGLVGYALMPTAPPRMYPEQGFVDTLAQSSSLNHGSGLVELASNPYAAMPSLHSADALIIGLVLASLVRPLWLKVVWLLWPAWVWFAVMSTGNHFWLDIVAGVGVAGFAATILASIETRRQALSPVSFGPSRW